MTRLRRGDGGFTLIELVITVAIMGVLVLPLGNFVIAYFRNEVQTQARLGGSHDVQIASAYFSQDVANTGLRGTASPYTPQQSIWTAPTGSYCGNSLGGTPVLLLEWDDWSVSGSAPNFTGTNTVHSVAYVSQAGALLRAYCASGTASPSVTTVVHNYVSASAACATAGTAVSCTAAPPPSSITLTVNINSSGDTQTVRLVGQRRQST